MPLTPVCSCLRRAPPLRSEGGVVVFGRICHEVYIKREILMPVKEGEHFKHRCISDLDSILP